MTAGFFIELEITYGNFECQPSIYALFVFNL